MKDFDLSKIETYDIIIRDELEVRRLFDKDGNFLGEIIIDPKEQGMLRALDEKE